MDAFYLADAIIWLASITYLFLLVHIDKNGSTTEAPTPSTTPAIQTVQVNATTAAPVAAKLVSSNATVPDAESLQPAPVNGAQGEQRLDSAPTVQLELSQVAQDDSAVPSNVTATAA